MFGMQFWCETHRLFRAVVIIIFQCQHHAPGGHGPGVVVAAFDLVPGIVLRGAISVIYPFYHRKPLFDHIVVDKAGCDLVFAACPNLIAIAYTFFAHMRRSGPGADKQTRFARICVGPFGRVDPVLSRYVRCPIIVPDGLKRLMDLVFRVDIPEMIEPGPGLAEKLIAETALRILVGGMLLEIDILDEILAIP